MLKCKVNTKEFQEGLKKLNKYKIKSDLEILDTIKITITDDKLQLMRTDLVNHITITINNVRVTEADTIIIKDVKEIEKSFKFMKESFTEIKTDKDNNIIIKNGSRSIKIKGENSKEYPESPIIKNIENKYTYNTKSLYNRLKKVDFARSNDKCRPILRGVCFNEDDIITLDGYRMVVDADNTLKVKKSFVINDKVTEYLLKILDRKNELDLHISKTNQYAIFEFEDIKIISKLLEGQFLNYKDILPKTYQETMILDTKKFKEDINFLNIQGKKIVQLSTQDKTLTMKINSDKGNLKTITKIDDNNKIFIAFDSKFMKDTIKQVEGQEFRLCYNGELNPLILEDNNTKFLVLPIRINR